MDVLPAVRTEIEALHGAFVAWFTGSVPDDRRTFDGLVATVLRARAASRGFQSRCRRASDLPE